MKRYTFLFAVAVSLTLAACGSGSSTPKSTDSTAVANSTDTTHQKDTSDYKAENAARLKELKDSAAK